MNSKPNFLVLMADQMMADALPFMGNWPVHAPRMSALADEGVVFTSAYCPSPLCAPSRFALMAGQLASRIGAFDNAAEFASDTPTIAHYLRAGGWHTILSGKMHFVGADQMHGFEERLTTDIYPADFGWTPDWTRPQDRPSWYHSMDSVLTAGPTVRTNQIDFDEEVVFTTRRKLYDIARDPQARPFFMVASLTHPHDPFAIHRRYWDLYEGVDIPMPRHEAGDVPADPHSARLRHVCGADLDPVTPEQVHAARRAYFGAISFVDEQFGQILDTLAETGLAENTIILICGDHGEMLGERGLWYKMNFFENAARVPMVIHAPARFAPRRVSASVSTLDFLPTLLDLAGLPPADAAPVDGRSLVPHLEGTGGHDEALGDYMGEGAIAPIVMIRRGPWKFIHSPVDPDQLYNLVLDPGETRNCATDPGQAARVADLRAEVARRWDLPGIEAAVLASQRRRRLVAQANATGRLTHWDHQPPRDAAQDYIRAHMDLEQLEALARFPRVRFD
jgi:choline-sulfatase